MKKIFISILSLFALIGCGEESNEVKEVRVIQTPPPVVFQFDDRYTMQDVEQNYLMCLITNGIDQDDLCEEICSDIYDAESCDTIEDKYEELYGIGSDSPKMVVSPFKSKTIKTSGKWLYSSPSCTHSPTKASVEKGKSFKQTEICITKKQKTTYYKDGSKFTQYGSERDTSSSMKIGTGKKVNTIDSKSTTVTNKNDSKAAAKYSSNLSSSTTKTEPVKTVPVKPVVKTEDAKSAAKFSSNLSSSTTKTEPVKPVVKTEDVKSAAKYSSNLSSSTTKTEPVKTETVEDSGISATDVAAVAAVGAVGASVVKPKSIPKKPTIVSTSSWVASGNLYSCSSFSPSTSKYKKGRSFTQSSNCKQKEKKTTKMSDGTVKIDTRVVSKTKSKIAHGTKASSSSKSSSSSSKSSSSSSKSKKKKKY